MRPTRVLLTVSVGTGALSALAALLSAERAAAQYGLAASAALVGYVLLARPAVPRARPALAAGVGLFAVLMVVRLWWLPEQPADIRWMTPFYAPMDGGGASMGPVQVPPTILDQWRQAIDQERLAAVGLLLQVLCLAVAVIALPVRRGSKGTWLAGVVAVLLLAVVGVNVWSRVDGAPLLGLLGAGWPALLATLAAAGTLALSGARADRAALVPLGALLIALSSAVILDDLTNIWSTWWRFTNSSDDAFLEAGVAVSAARSAGMSAVGWADVSAALRTGMALAGTALFAVGAVTASRDAEPV
ncbi:hypothetical protein ABGB16_32135 [Micromonospora sp. B11E3]|uniref:hypothetical protein n=1 Tax=Micromonospora sp. B11E3 TaxID=3153562 RepID=UPI00325E83F1